VELFNAIRNLIATAESAVANGNLDTEEIQLCLQAAAELHRVFTASSVDQ